MFKPLSRLLFPATLLALCACSASGASAPAVAASPANPNAKTESVVLGMGCFWGAEKRMGELPGVVDVEAGYAGGDDPKVHYEDLHNQELRLRAGKSTARNHAEVVKVTFDPGVTTLEKVLVGFWENHDPTRAIARATTWAATTAERSSTPTISSTGWR